MCAKILLDVERVKLATWFARATREPRWVVAFALFACVRCTSPAQKAASELDAAPNTGRAPDAAVADASSPERQDGGFAGTDAASPTPVCAQQELPLGAEYPEREAPVLTEDVVLPDAMPTMSDMHKGLASYILNLEAPELEAMTPREIAELGETGTQVMRALTLSGVGRADEGLLELRRILHANDACSDYPTTLDELVRAWGDFRDVSPRVVTNSQVTQRDRVIYDATELGLFVAQAVDDDGNVLETELIRTGARTDNALVFLVYDELGRRSDAAQLFVSGQEANLPSPFTCMVCHRTFGTPRFDVVNPLVE